MKTLSAAADRNKEPIFKILMHYLGGVQAVLEIGSGTGQHFAYACEHLPMLRWQCTDTKYQITTLSDNVSALARTKNQPDPIQLNMNSEDWLSGDRYNDQFDAIYTANTLHIMSQTSVENFFLGAEFAVRDSGLLLIYGPFKIEGEFTSESNAAFDQALRDNDPYRGIRDLDWIVALAKSSSFGLQKNIGMPANNQLLVFEKNKLALTKKARH